MDTHTYIHTYIHTYTHTYIHIHRATTVTLAAHAHRGLTSDDRVTDIIVFINIRILNKSFRDHTCPFLEIALRSVRFRFVP